MSYSWLMWQYDNLAPCQDGLVSCAQLWLDGVVTLPPTKKTQGPFLA